MSGFDRETAIKMIVDGIAPAVAIARCSRRRPADDPRLIRMIVPTGGIAHVPDPACVARQLEGIDKPTRADVERAMTVCER